MVWARGRVPVGVRALCGVRSEAEVHEERARVLHPHRVLSEGLARRAQVLITVRGKG